MNSLSLFCIERLRQYNSRRNYCVQIISEKNEDQQSHESGNNQQQTAVRPSSLIPFLQVLRTSVGFHCIIIFTTIVVIISVFSTTRSLTLFSLHPICMTLGAVLCIPQGVVVYRNDSLLETLSPIMQHNKRTKVRTIHQTLQLMGTVFLLLGGLLILAHKVELRESILPTSFHSILGSSLLLLLLIQVVVGNDKLENLENNKKKGPTRKWHGDLGLLLWDALCVAVMSGLMSLLKLSLTHLLVESTILIVWLAVHLQMLNVVSLNIAASSRSLASTSKRKGSTSTDSFEEGDGSDTEPMLDETALLDMESSTSSPLPSTSIDSVANHSNSKGEKGEVVVNNNNYISKKKTSGYTKYSDFYGYAEDIENDEGAFV